MQILYVAREPLEAESAANVLRDLAPDTEVLWASRFDQAEVWIDRHHDLAALLVDVEVDGAGCGAFLRSLRTKGVNAAVVAITPDGTRLRGGLLSEGADDSVEKGDAFSSALRDALARALARVRTEGSSRWDHLRLSTPTAAHEVDTLAGTDGDATAVDRLAECQTAVEAAISLLFPSASDSCSALSSRLTDVEATFDAVTAELGESRSRIVALEQQLTEARRSFQETLDRVSSEHAAACGQFDQKLCDADLALDSLRREHAWAVTENERLTRRGIELASQLGETRATMLRQFEESPLPMCRCTRDGRLTTANGAFLQLVGHPSVEDLRRADFGEAVFESAGDLRWLIERAVSSAGVAAFETTWRTKEGSRLAVRVSASAKMRDAVEIAVEDLTSVRSLEERLGPAQRMESVGRLASEVAVTCANLLGDVHQDVQRWLNTAGTDASLRHQGQILLDEVTRASGFLRQLAAYGDEQTSALSPVDLNKVLRDLGPVLKRVAGDEVDFELPRPATPLIVDVPADRVERLLVNLAAYGRERMPFGGRLNIELGTVTLDQAFLEKYPNVRRGQHALITATEIRRTTRAEGPLRLREPAASLGVDLGALQGLIRECGGHLWVTAVPHGDMVVRIHLPLRSADAARASTLGLAGSLLTRH